MSTCRSGTKKSFFYEVSGGCESCTSLSKHIHVQMVNIYIKVQPIAFGVSFNRNLQSPFIGLFSTERGKRDLEN